MAFNSSRGFDWEPSDGARSLRMEIWILDEDGEPRRVTAYNDAADRRQRAVTSDFAWGPEGELLVYRAQFDGRRFLQSVDVVELE